MKAEAQNQSDPVSDANQAHAYAAACKEVHRRGLRDFFDWLCDKENPLHLMVCELLPHWDYPEPISAEQYGEKLFAAYFEIDMDAVERNRVRILDNLQKDGEA